MNHQYDVVVLGFGIAGSAAAMAAASAGARVCLLAGKPGTTSLYSGAWRGPCPEELRTGLARSGGYALEKCDGVLPGQNGQLHTCDYTTTSHQHARLDKDTVVCGIAGLPGFEAAGLAAQWSDQADVSLRAEVITIMNTPAAGWAPVSLASLIDENWKNALAPLRQLNAQRVVLPAILGWKNPWLHEQIEKYFGLEIGEAIATTPSLPGWRLGHSLSGPLMDVGVILEEGRATSAQVKDGRITSVNNDRDVFSARSFVLATGKYIGGGITADGVFREPLFDCPVWVDHLDEVFESAEPLLLTDVERAEPQPLLAAGVHVDADNRPVNRQNDVVYENVFACGSVRAGWDANTDIGKCAEDGWRAGLKAAIA